MHLVEFSAESRQRAGLRMRAIYKPNVAYLVPDKLAEALRTFAGLRSLRAFQPPNPWPPRNPKGGRFLIYHLGGLGDYLAFLPPLLALQLRYPTATLDLCTEPMGYELLRCGAFGGGLAEYPLRKEVAESYDAALFIDDVTDHRHFRDWDLVDVFADIMGLSGPVVYPRFDVSTLKGEVAHLPKAVGPRIGIQFNGSSPLRSYPVALARDLLKELVRAGFETHVFGEPDACQAPSAPPRFHNWCGRTDHPAKLVALVAQMDALIVPDSFLMHLGGLMGKPTVAMFTTVASRLRTRYYSSVEAVEPSIGCNPCFGRSTCPMGHDHCLIWDHPAMSPRRIVNQILRLPSIRMFDTAGGALCNQAHA